MADNLRALKDEAAKLVIKGKLKKALDAYEQVIAADPTDLTSQLKCGEVLRRLSRTEEAIERYEHIARSYASEGLLMRAIAACKVILELDPKHTSTQQMIADLYGRKTGKAPTGAGIPKAARWRRDRPNTAIPLIPLFSDLPKSAFIEVMDLLHVRNVAANESIIREGDIGDTMYIVSTGEVRAVRSTEKGGSQFLARLGEGAFFGEMALMGESPRTASVVAEKDSVLFELTRDMLAKVVAQYPSVERALTRFYRQRLLTNLINISPLFRGLNEQERMYLLEQFKSREMPAHHKIIVEGEVGDALYVLLSGRADVWRLVNGNRQKIATLREGAVFGEMSLFTDQPVIASVTTSRKSIVLRLTKSAFMKLIELHPNLMSEIRAFSNLPGARRASPHMPPPAIILPPAILEPI